MAHPSQELTTAIWRMTALGFSYDEVALALHEIGQPHPQGQSWSGPVTRALLLTVFGRLPRPGELEVPVPLAARLN
ncbi:hypothetical protein HNR42_002880 [Deinobacterium chartae]|uniref:Uncharacterized protein n=1 Tax=Deinobacterium chartae TaxID=521158 RepID=A0A841I584_9DEIO|nr:hypothetical protein [Deinobacterium chartae]MBB6099439.1 hypothetical protein [Deinobacterium chartae]